MRISTTAALAFLLLAPATASAELRRVQLNVLGMDWEICAHTVRVALMKLDGIESAEVSLTTATADIRLKPDNRITLPQLRELLKKNGYPTRDAQVSARGKAVERDGKRVFDLLNGSTIGLAETPGASSLAVNQIVEIAGTSRAIDKASEKLTVK